MVLAQVVAPHTLRDVGRPETVYAADRAGVLVASNTQVKSLKAEATSTIEQKIRQEAKARGVSADLAVAIASCESGVRQFDTDGSVLKNPTSSAVGVFQIMATVHEANAKKAGLDIRVLQDNIAFGISLMKSQGTTPWEASRYCWAKKSG